MTEEELKYKRIGCLLMMVVGALMFAATLTLIFLAYKKWTGQNKLQNLKNESIEQLNTQ